MGESFQSCRVAQYPRDGSLTGFESLLQSTLVPLRLFIMGGHSPDDSWTIIDLRFAHFTSSVFQLKKHDKESLFFFTLEVGLGLGT